MPLSEEDKAEARRLIDLRIKDWNRTHGDETPTRPHVDDEDGLVRGDYAILKLALEHAEAECARLRGLIAALPCEYWDEADYDCRQRVKDDSDWEPCPMCKAKEAANG